MVRKKRTIYIRSRAGSMDTCLPVPRSPRVPGRRILSKHGQYLDVISVDHGVDAPYESDRGQPARSGGAPPRRPHPPPPRRGASWGGWAPAPLPIASDRRHVTVAHRDVIG